MAGKTIKPGADIGIIGGSGLYNMDGLTGTREIRVRTPFGDPSDALVVGLLDGVRTAFLSRHGRGHRIAPADINYRANIYALKALGVTRVISVSAVGSMKEALKPGHVILPDQFIDLTKRRAGTFFEKGVVAHVAFADPVCGALSRTLHQAAQGVGATTHRGGVYLCIEGPQFSSRGESLLYRQWGVDVIGMTNMPEAKLAREAELCYATMALATDYDCWHSGEESVTVEMILATLQNNVAQDKRILRAAVPAAAGARTCSCATALQYAIVTAPEKISPAMRRKLQPLIGKYLEKS
jgi:5'-methylthioadenosine phosphorylase